MDVRIGKSTGEPVQDMSFIRTVSTGSQEGLSANGSSPLQAQHGH